jgi:predicted DNA-binding transcriptional regulator YafY
MGSSRKVATPPSSSVSLERAARLHRLVEFLGGGPRTRQIILKKLKIDIRTFYRDLELLRDCKIEVSLEARKYALVMFAKDALLMLPFPDPCLTLGEAQQLAKGRSKIHQKLRDLLKQIVKTR